MVWTTRWILVVAVLGLPGAPGARADHATVSPPAIVDALPAAPSVAERLEELRRRIHDALEYPPLARSREIEGQAKVAFEIGGDRRAKDVALEASSGHPILDRAALRAVETAEALPMIYGRLVVPIAFDLRGH